MTKFTMPGIMTGILKLAGAFALICGGLAFWEMRQTEMDIRVTVQDADAAVKETQKRLADTSQNLNAALLQIGLMTDEGRRASIEQRQYWASVSKETIAAVRDARGLIQASTAGVNQTTADLHGAVTTANLDLVTLDSALQSLDAAIRDADRNFAGNPDATRALKSLADSGEQIEQTTANVKQMSDDVRQKVHDLTHPKPQRWFVILGEKLLDIGYKVKAFI